MFPIFLLLAAAVNPLLIRESEVPDKPIPFGQIQPEHIAPAIEARLAEAREKLAAWKAQTGPRTFQNTVVAFRNIDRELAFTISVVRVIQSTASTPAFEKAASAAIPAAGAFRQSLPSDPEASAIVTAFAKSPAAQSLTGADRRLLDVTLDAFRRNGASLDAPARARLNEINRELGRLSLQFADNLRRATAAWEHYVTNEAELSGLPAWLRQSARAEAEKRGKPGWRISLQFPVTSAIHGQADNAALRETVSHALATRASEQNTPNADRQLALRTEKAKLLGYASFADYQTEDRMAKSGAGAQQFLSKLEAGVRPAAAREKVELQAFRRELEGPTAPPLQPWDVAYYANKLSKKVNNYDEEAVRPYFPLPRVLDGLFAFVNRLYGLEFTRVDNPAVLDPSVTYYRVSEKGQTIAYMYMDLFLRDTKQGGAWQQSLITGFPGRPHVGGIYANLTPPAPGRPALLTHRQVETLFHEMGHYLHMALSRVPHPSLGGTAVAWDFVELPSQLMENFLYEKEILTSISGHYETGEKLPAALYEAIRKTRSFRAGTLLLARTGQSVMDLLLHSEYRGSDAPGGLRVYARRIMDSYAAIPPLPEANPVSAFTHLFSGAYAAGFYSYLWSDMLDADAYTKYNPRAFREKILERGNSVPADAAYKDFAGAEPDVKSLLRKYGINP